MSADAYVSEYGIQKVLISQSGEQYVWLYYDVKGTKWWSVLLSDVGSDAFIREYAVFLFSLLDQEHDKGIVFTVDHLEDTFPVDFEERGLIVQVTIALFLFALFLFALVTDSMVQPTQKKAKTDDGKPTRPAGRPWGSETCPPELLPLSACRFLGLQAWLRKQWAAELLVQRHQKAIGGEKHAGLVPVYASARLKVLHFVCCYNLHLVACSCCWCSQGWEFLLLCLGEEEGTKKFLALGEEDTTWSWSAAREAWVCKTKILVKTPAQMDSLVDFGWTSTQFASNRNDVLDCRSVCQTVDLVYHWKNGELEFRAWFKKFDRTNEHMAT